MRNNTENEIRKCLKYDVCALISFFRTTYRAKRIHPKCHVSVIPPLTSTSTRNDRCIVSRNSIIENGSTATEKRN